MVMLNLKTCFSPQEAPRMRVDIVEKKYGERPALRNIHVTFPKGQTTLIIGTSGAGKSTLIKCMIGTTSFNGKITDYKPEEIVYIPQHPALNDRETAQEAVYWSALFSRLYPQSRINSVVTDYIRTMGLESVKDNEIRRLSGGQKQRVSIAKELIRKKSIIIADEIDTGLDCGVSRDLVQKLCGITKSEKKTTVIVSHNIVNIELYDQVVVLVKSSSKCGGIAYAGIPRNIRSFFEVNDYVDILSRVNAADEGGRGEADRFIRKFASYHR